MENWLAFSAATVALLFVPGPTNTLIATNGAILGLRRTFGLLPAELCGYLMAIGAWALGIGVASQHIASASIIAALAASLVLLISAIKLALSDGHEQGRSASRRTDIFFVTLCNPKALIFALTIVPFLRDGDVPSALPYLVWLSVLIVAIGAVWSMIGAGIARQFRLAISPRFFARAGAVILLFFSIFLFVTTVVRALHGQ